MKHYYEVIGSGVDHTGWFKVWLRRDDGKEVKVSKKRVADLRREGRVTTADDAFGDCRSAPATCKKNEYDEICDLYDNAMDRYLAATKGA